MRVLLSTIGSRGDVQPLVALALQLRALGQDVRLCVPPDFGEWIAGLGFEAGRATCDRRDRRAVGRRRFNDSFRAALDEHRAAIGLAPVADVRSHVLTDRPWLAADRTVGPWPDPGTVFQPACASHESRDDRERTHAWPPRDHLASRFADAVRSDGSQVAARRLLEEAS